MAPRSESWVVPAGSFILAVLLSMASGSSIRALTMRMQADTTSDACQLISLEFVPILDKAKVKRIKSVSGNMKKAEIVEEEIEQPLVDANPNPGGGKRIFVGKRDLDDTREHDIIVVLARVANAKSGTIITFEAQDVDDPSAGDIPEGNFKTQVRNRLANIKRPDHVVLLEQTLNHDDRPVVDWEEFVFDNRGDILRQSGGHNEGKQRGGCDLLTWGEAKLTDEQKQALQAKNLTEAHFRGLTRPQHTHDADVVPIICKRGKVPVNVIDADGTARVAVFLKVSHQPGDNYKVLAICDQPSVTYTLRDDHGNNHGVVVYKGDKILDKTVPVQDDGTDARVVMREKALATPGNPRGPSRKFNIIFDYHPPAKVAVTNMLTVWRRLHVELDYMESTANSTSKHQNDIPFAVIQQPGTPLEDYPIPFAGPGGENTPLISPDLSGMQRNTVYPSAYVDVVDDIGVKWNKSPLRVFTRNISGNLLGAKDFDRATKISRNLDTAKKRQRSYWVVHLVGGYEHDDQKCNDPDTNDGGNTLGGLSSGLHELDLLSSMVFHETIRDLKKMGGNLLLEEGPANLANKTASQILQDTYAHEATHQFDFPKHADGGVMSVVQVYGVANSALADFSRAKIRSSNGP